MRHIKALLLAILVSALCAGQEKAYLPGEKIYFDIHYGIIQGGVVSLELRTDTFRGREVWHSTLLGRTTGMADAVFRVKDIYESFMEPSTGLPVFSIRNIREGRYTKYNEVIFDHYSRSDSSVLTSDLTGIHVTEKGIHDILSCFYAMRDHHLPKHQTMKKGDVITINTWFTDEYFPVIMRYMGTEEVRTKVGRIKCLKFNPVTEVGRLFKTQDDVTFWFTADKNHLPVRIRFNIFVGAFIAEIVNYEGLKYPLEIRGKDTNQ